MNLKNLLRKYKKRILFTTPSHNQGNFIIPDLKNILGKNFFENDFSEIEGFDNIKNPTGAIKNSLSKAAQLYGVANTFYLTNGSTQGILTILLSFLEYNDLIIVAENCHQAVFDGISLAQARAIVLNLEYDSEWGIYKPITADAVYRAFQLNPKAKAFVLSCPYYEGIISDIEKISRVCKELDKILIVDEAHGALWSFDNSISIPAAYLGADAVVQSLHKTCGAPNQCSLLHLPKNSKLSFEKINNTYNKLMTTSPSYPLLFSIERTIDFLFSPKGKKMIYELVDNIIDFKKKFKDYPSIKFYNKFSDETKILVKIDGLSGKELSKRIYEQFKIEDELANDVSVLYLTGIGTTKNKLKKLENALKKIADSII